MTATDILRSLRGALPALSTHRNWIQMLLIAEAGDQGITKADLSQATHVPPHPRTIRRWHAAGLIVVDRTSTRGRPVTRYRILPKGLRLLRLPAD
jgi:ATP-dependent Zn protease